MFGHLDHLKNLPLHILHSLFFDQLVALLLSMELVLLREEVLLVDFVSLHHQNPLPLVLFLDVEVGSPHEASPLYIFF